MGPCAGGAAYSPALTDFIFMTEDTSYMFLTGPDVIRSVLNEKIDKNELGSSDIHSKISGLCDKAFPNDIEMLASMRKFLQYLP